MKKILSLFVGALTTFTSALAANEYTLEQRLANALPYDHFVDSDNEDYYIAMDGRERVCIANYQDYEDIFVFADNGYTLSFADNKFYYTNNSDSRDKLTFELDEEETVARITWVAPGKQTREFNIPVDPQILYEEEIAQLIGDVVYERVGEAYCYEKIYVNGDGRVCGRNGEYEQIMRNSFYIDVIDNGYAMSDEEKNAYVFEVDSENKLVLVLYRLYDYEVVYKAKTSAPTAIGGIGINKASKVVKTIENGKVVVIKNGVKYGLDGSVIK